MGITVLTIMFYLVNVGELLLILSRVQLQWVLAVALISLLFYAIRAYRWRLLLNPVKNSVRLSNTFWATILCYFANILIPTRIGGEVLKALIVGGREDIGFAECMSSVVVERLLDLLTVVVLAATALLIAPPSLYQGIEELALSYGLPALASPISILRAAALVSLACLALLLAGVAYEEKVLKLVNAVLRIFPLKERWKRSLLALTKSAIDGMRGVYQGVGATSLILLTSIAIWLVQVFSTIFLFAAFGVKISFLESLLGTMLMVLVFLFPAAPGFVGTYQVFWTVIFSGILGVKLWETIFAVSLVSNALVVAVIIPLGAMGLAWLGMGVRELFRLRLYSAAGSE